MGVQFAGNIFTQSNSGPLPIAMGGTGQTTAPTAINALLPVQAGQAGKLLVTNGTNISWMSGTITPGGSDTQIQFNDSGSFGGGSFFTVNKSTGALTSTSTFKSIGLAISDADALYRTLSYQTLGSDRWFLQVNNTAEAGAGSGSDFEFVRVADNGLTTNIVYTVNRATGAFDFKSAPTVNGGPIGGVTSFNTRTGAITLTSSDVTTALGFTPQVGTVTSVDISGGTTGLSFGGGPITTDGTITAAGTLSVANGGTGSTIANTAFNTLAPAQVTQAGKFLTTDGSNTSWATVTAGTVTSVGGTGTVSGLTLTGTVTSTGNLTLGGTLSLTSGQVTTGLGYTPVNNTGDTMTGSLTATGFVGPLTGNADTATNVAYSGLTGTVPTWNQDTTGNAATADVAITAGTVTTAAQPAITSVGTLTSINTAGPVTINNIGTITTATLTTSSTAANQVIDSVATAAYRVATYGVSVTYGTDCQYSEVKMIHNTTNVYVGEINTILTGALLATFTADISGGIMRLLTTPVNAITTFKTVSILVAA